MHTGFRLCQWTYCILDLFCQWNDCILDLWFVSEAIVYSISALSVKLLYTRSLFRQRSYCIVVSVLSIKLLYARSLRCQWSYCPFVLLINVMINHYSCLHLSHVNRLFRSIKLSKLKWYNKIPKRFRYGIFIESFFCVDVLRMVVKRLYMSLNL